MVFTTGLHLYLYEEQRGSGATGTMQDGPGLKDKPVQKSSSTQKSPGFGRAFLAAPPRRWPVSLLALIRNCAVGIEWYIIFVKVCSHNDNFE